MLATGVTATRGVLAVLADTTMAGRHVPTLLAVLVKLYACEERAREGGSRQRAVGFYARGGVRVTRRTDTTGVTPPSFAFYVKPWSEESTCCKRGEKNGEKKKIAREKNFITHARRRRIPPPPPSRRGWSQGGAGRRVSSTSSSFGRWDGERRGQSLTLVGILTGASTKRAL